ncbi:SGNH/GDSL hydrolase family protein [Kribbella sp. NBC_01484]|uniref:SGNH/GDSL hydrolase family protein n=1 Tax=Kribbella sp. NBC_01484 TaxID=2903579 RepID=UPI002E36C126|nr:SGNH/GDSL hydrolase family protein [Kribbella sp. NBC_01484]
MPRLRRFITALLLIALVAILAGGGVVSAAPRPPVPPVPPVAQLHVVALGDSVTSGTACSCAAFPSMYDDLLHTRTGDTVTVDNLGAGGLDSTGLLRRLDQPNSPTEQAISVADIVLLTIGANDFGDHHDDVTAGRCTDTDCVADEREQLTVNLHRILGRIHTLRGGQPTTILATGYWNVFEDGEVARRTFPATGRAATDQLTLQVNAAIAGAAQKDDATYVDIYTPFESDAADVTTLLAPDGDHPNAAGHALIARLLLEATPSH